MRSSKNFAMASAIAIIGLTFVANGAQAQQRQAVPKSTLKMEQSEADTLTVTCAEATAMVKGHNGVLLRTGSNRFDRYHRKGGECFREDAEMIPAFVRTKDNMGCFIGYTCESEAGE